MKWHRHMESEGRACSIVSLQLDENEFIGISRCEDERKRVVTGAVRLRIVVDTK